MAGKRWSAFDEFGVNETIDHLKTEIQDLYCSDEIPWVVGYSGGKDSTAVLQLVWLSLADLPASKRHKTVHVISTDTLVENPVVASWVSHSLDNINKASEEGELPFIAHRLTPKVENTFWVNLLGKGYPAPRPKFRWCTERMKISPSHDFISSVVQKSGEAILVLGTRKAESSLRASNMKRHEKERTRGRLSPNAGLANSFIFSPIEEWTNDDVWLFLMQVKNPWGYNNKDLLTMYQGATADGECPLVVDTNTPSCGDSRFGCWVCTLVEKDKSMEAMILNDQEKEWMEPLLDLRNEIDFRGADGKPTDHDLRDFRRMNGNVQLYQNKDGEFKHIPGPYLQHVREKWLKQLIEAQQAARELGPDSVADLELITLAELEEIRRVWVIEKHELEDNLPRIYEAATGTPYPGRPLDDNFVFGREELDVLRDICGEDGLHFELARELLAVEKRYRTALRRGGITKSIEKAFERNFYEDSNDAIDWAVRRKDFQASMNLEDLGTEESPEGEEAAIK